MVGCHSDLVKCVKLDEGYFSISDNVIDGDRWVQSGGE